MIRLEETNVNTKEYYNRALIDHLMQEGITDYKDMPRIVKLLEQYHGGKLLDMGCGISYLPFMAWDIAQMPVNKNNESEIWALDFADKFITIMQTIMEMTLNVKKIKYVVGEIEHTPFEDNFFDYVVLGELLEHTENPQKVLDEAKRIIKDTGTIAISSPYGETKETHLYPQHIWGITPEDLGQMISIKRLDVIGNTIFCYGRKE